MNVPPEHKCLSCWGIAQGVACTVGLVSGVVGFAMSFWHWAGGVHAIFVLLASIIGMSSGFSAACCVDKCKMCVIVGSAVAMIFALLGVCLLAIPREYCEQHECDSLDGGVCNAMQPHLVDHDLPSHLAPGLICHNLISASSCGQRWCTWIDEDCGDQGTGDHAYWSFTAEEDCTEYAEVFTGFFIFMTIVTVVVGFLLVVITSVGAGVTGLMSYNQRVGVATGSSVHVAAAPSAQAVQLPALAVPTQQAMPQPAPQAVANVPVAGAMIDPATGAPLPQFDPTTGAKQNY